MSNQNLWRACCISAIIMAILTFTPLITPKGISKPELMGMPFTMWAGILQAIILIILTYFGTLIRARMESNEDDR